MAKIPSQGCYKLSVKGSCMRLSSTYKCEDIYSRSLFSIVLLYRSLTEGDT